MRSKYGNKKTDVDGIKFDSIKEARYYIYLRSLAESGKIKGLRLQVPFELLPDIFEEVTIRTKTKEKTGMKRVQAAVRYFADFVFIQDGKEVIVDVKSAATRKKDAYVLKKKMMRALLGIKIEEV